MAYRRKKTNQPCNKVYAAGNLMDVFRGKNMIDQFIGYNDIYQNDYNNPLEGARHPDYDVIPRSTMPTHVNNANVAPVMLSGETPKDFDTSTHSANQRYVPIAGKDEIAKRAIQHAVQPWFNEILGLGISLGFVMGLIYFTQTA